MAIIVSNSALTLEQMKGNAQYILDKLLAQGWTKNAICAMLGNMQSESTINSGRWEGGDSNNMSVGFGLVQWTPASKVTNWLDNNGFLNQWTSIEGQVDRIIYEVANGVQWITKPSYPISFVEFTTSNATPTYLAGAFITNYERPFDNTQPIRGTQAEYWFSTLTGGGGTTPTTKKKKSMPLYMYRLF